MEPTTRQYLLPGIAQHLKGLTTTLEQVGEPHRSAGRRLADWTAKNYREGELLPLVVVCTGNSRRSMLGAMMGNVSAAYYGLPEVRYFSGGTAPSAFNSRTITTLQAIGFEVAPIGEEALRGEPELPNPKYRVRWGTIQPGSPSLPEAVEFSKVFECPRQSAERFCRPYGVRRGGCGVPVHTRRGPPALDPVSRPQGV